MMNATREQATILFECLLECIRVREALGMHKEANALNEVWLALRSSALEDLVNEEGNLN